MVPRFLKTDDISPLEGRPHILAKRAIKRLPNLCIVRECKADATDGRDRHQGSWIMMRSATDLSKADLHVFSKLFDDGLERGQEAEAFSGRQISGQDDVLEFLVGHLINVEMTRQPAP